MFANLHTYLGSGKRGDWVRKIAGAKEAALQSNFEMPLYIQQQQQQLQEEFVQEMERELELEEGGGGEGAGGEGAGEDDDEEEEKDNEDDYGFQTAAEEEDYGE